MDLKNKILKAARADTIPEGDSGLWIIKKTFYDHDEITNWRGKQVILPAGVYTHLIRVTTAKLHLWPPGEVVMEDTPFELNTHLNFMLHACGDVLVTGLGLGCVIRGLLMNPRVNHITCIEKSDNVLNLVAPYIKNDRLTIIKADALNWCKDSHNKFDCAWHDLWTNREDGEPHLDLWHTELFAYCKKKVRFQGAWAYPREFKKAFRNKNMSLI